MNRKILVTGGAGFVGSHAILRLIESGRDVIVLDNLHRGHREVVENTLNVPLIEGDIADSKLVAEVFQKYDIGTVMHFAALAYVGESVESPEMYYKNNVTGTINLLEQMVAANIKRFIFSSTCATFGRPEEMPITEQTTQIPVNPYGKSKLMVENILSDFDTAYGLKSIILRYFNASGADPEGRLGEEHFPETHLLPLILQTALRTRRNISIFGTDYPTPDGTCIRDYVHVSDLADAHFKALELLENDIKSDAFNLGIGVGYSVRQAIEICRTVTDRTIDILEEPRREGDPAILIADNKKARELLGWNPIFTDLTQAIEHTWAWMLSQK